MIGKLIFGDYPFADFGYELGDYPNMESNWHVVCPEHEPCGNNNYTPSRWQKIPARDAVTKRCEADK